MPLVDIKLNDSSSATGSLNESLSSVPELESVKIALGGSGGGDGVDGLSSMNDSLVTIAKLAKEPMRKDSAI